jgi:hypothetical protein
MKEIWKDVVGYEGLYEINTLGDVRSKAKWIKTRFTGYIRKPAPIKSYRDKFGYKKVSLYKKAKQKGLFVHRLLGQAFICNTENKPHINHIDHNKKNNSLDNLEWVTRSENIKKAYEFGKMLKGELSPAASLSNSQACNIIVLLQVRSPKIVSIMTGVRKEIVRAIYRRLSWNHMSEHVSFLKPEKTIKKFTQKEVVRIKNHKISKSDRISDLATELKCCPTAIYKIRKRLKVVH